MFTRNERILLALMALVQFAHILDFIIIMPLGPYLMRLLDINTRQFGLVLSAYTYSAGVAGLLAALVLDRFDRRKALLVAFGGFTLGTIACAIAPTYELLLLARMVAGAFGGVSGSLVLAIIGDQIPMARRGTAMGVVMTSFSVASIVGVPAGLMLADIWGWNAPFYIIGGLSMLVLPGIWLLLPSMRGHLLARTERPSALHLIPDILRNTNQRNALLLMVLLIFAQFLVVPFISPSMVLNVGLKETDLKYIYLVGGFATIITAPLVGRMSDRFGHRRVFQWFAVGSLAFLALITNLGPAALYVVLSIAAGFFIFSGGRNIPSTAMVTGAVPPRIRGGFMSLNSALQQIAIGAATTVGSLIVTEDATGRLTHYSTTGFLSIGITLVAVWLAPKIKVYQDPAPAPQDPTEPPITAEAAVAATA